MALRLDYKRFWILIIIAFATISVIPAYSGESCIFCHTDSSFTVGYGSSSHGFKGVSCNACHVKSVSILRFLGKKYLDLLTFSFKNAHIAERASTENCLKCHQAINRLNVIAEDALPEQLRSIGMVIEHQKHFNLRDSCKTCHASGKFIGNKALQRVSHSDPMGCAACHINISHETSHKYGGHFPSEKNCGICHKGSSPCPSLKEIADIKDENRCTDCHPNQYSF